MAAKGFSKWRKSLKGTASLQRRLIYSQTGEWNKKISRKTITDIERHWKTKVLATNNKGDAVDEKMYILSMFPYPSGELHMGHMRVYTVSDVLARHHRLNGKQVLHPIGWDAFGLPAENAAIDRGLAPKEWTYSNIARMKQQLKELRISFDWDKVSIQNRLEILCNKKEFATCDPEYYKWTQLLFLQMYSKGLAYLAEAPVNWDPVDQTVLAAEQIDSQGHSWRSGAKVEKKYLKQWYLRTTYYSKSLLEGLDTLDQESCKGFANAQRNWIGETTGVRVNVRLQPGDEVLPVFTDTPELLHHAAFLQISQQHSLAHRLNITQDGVILFGVKMLNPLTGKRIPIIVSNSSKLTDTNTSRFGFPALEWEDAQLAEKVNLSASSADMFQNGHLMNAGFLTGMKREDAHKAVCDYLKKNQLGGHPTSSDLQDWLISRQRYWGTPVPIIHCDACNVVPVPTADLPVILPEVTTISSKGGNPLAEIKDWVNVECPQCGKPAKRETDTMDTFVDSSWYYLRYTDPHNSQAPFSAESAAAMMPVDVYIGGAEHAILHMFYARFFSHFLFEEGQVRVPEPFSLQLALGTVHSDCYQVAATGKYLPKNKVKIQGDVLTEKGTGQAVTVTVEKMSKSKLNGVSPQHVLDQHGVDQTRLYMLANAAPRSMKYWNPDLVKKLQFSQGRPLSIPRWMHTLWHSVSLIRERRERLSSTELMDTHTDSDVVALINKTRNNTIRLVTLHLNITFNLHDAIYALYDALYAIDGVPLETKVKSPAYERCLSDLVVLMHPFAPHITAELWEGLRSTQRLPNDDYNYNKANWESDVFSQNWPRVDKDFKLPLTIHEIRSSGSTLDNTTTMEKHTVDGLDEMDAGEQMMTRTLHLPRDVLESLDLSRALELAGYKINFSTKATKKDSDVNRKRFIPTKLTVTKNCAATLVLGDDAVAVKESKRECQAG